MNTKILSVLPLSLFLAACVSPPSINPALVDCKSQGWGSCKGEPQAPTVNINTKSGKLKASPYCVKAEEGTELVFRITPRNNKAAGDVEILPKDPAHAWLKGENSPNKNFIFIDVPNDLDPDARYFYGIKSGGECVDPRVHVVN